VSATAEVLIRDLSARGVRLSRNGDRLHYVDPRGVLTPELRKTLSEAKPAILAALDASDARLDIRAELERLALAEGIAAELVQRLSADDVAACAGLSSAALRAYVRVLRDAELRARGEVPPDETAAIQCVRCGPVFVAAEVAQVLPIIGGTPTAAGCPWCFNRKAGLQIPRPESNPDHERQIQR
jgi:hypothetical protein